MREFSLGNPKAVIMRMSSFSNLSGFLAGRFDCLETLVRSCLHTVQRERNTMRFEWIICCECFIRCGTLVKELPSLTWGVVGNSRLLLMVRDPASRLYRLDITSRRSDVVLTGRKRLRGTLMPKALSKHLIAAPTAVSSWMTFRPPSRVWERGRKLF